ncbi:MAG: hypothetical protein MPN21_09550 [Thermoanaerobaculia bacterium]|nr:hypothetical protein [Thermoanaerobaculia bacterium]
MHAAGHRAVLGIGLALACASSLHGEPIPFGEPFQVNVHTTGIQNRPSIASFPAGDFLIVWESVGQDGDSGGIYARRYDSSGAPLTGETQVNAFTVDDQDQVKVKVGPQGFVAVWRDGVFDGDGSIMVKTPGQDEFLANTHTTGSQTSPDLVMDSNGDFVVVWHNQDDQDGDGSGIFGQRFDSAGGFVDSEFQVNTTTSGAQTLPAVDGLGDGRFVVTWNTQTGSGDQVMAQRFASDGSKLGAEVSVNTLGRSPDVAMGDDGSFVVVWMSDAFPTGEIYSRHFDSNGDPTSAGLPVASTAGLGGYLQSIRRTPSGEFTVLWTDSTSGNVRMRRLSADGTATGEEFIVTPEGFAAEIAFTGTFDSTGLVTWFEADTDGDSLGVFARQIVERLYADGFESGNTDAWSLVVP